MPQIEVSRATDEHIKAIALLLETTPVKVVEQLVRQAKDSMVEHLPPVPSPGSASGPGEAVGVYLIYQGHRVEGELVPRTGKLTITSPFWKGRRRFGSPSGAASAVIEYFNPARVVIRNGKEHGPSVNGWDKWRLASNGQLIRTVRPG